VATSKTKSQYSKRTVGKGKYESVFFLGVNESGEFTEKNGRERHSIRWVTERGSSPSAEGKGTKDNRQTTGRKK